MPLVQIVTEDQIDEACRFYAPKESTPEYEIWVDWISRADPGKPLKVQQRAISRIRAVMTMARNGSDEDKERNIRIFAIFPDNRRKRR